MTRRAAFASLAILTGSLAAAPLGAAAAPATERAPIVISNPDFRPLPIAVPAFAGEGTASGPAGVVTSVVRSDLNLSGLFNVLDPKGYLADPREGVDAAAIGWRRWSDVGADGLVKAVIGVVGAELVGELHLYEVRASREVLVKSLRVPATTPRALGHRMADEIVRYYTHEPGIFATRIAAIRVSTDQYQLVTMDVDGQNLQVHLSEKETLLLPAWRPDGSEILVTSYRTGRPELWVYRFADQSFRSLGHRGNSFSGVYSPDGKRIAFCLMEGGNSNVWVMNADGSGGKRLTREPPINISPAWSPDGTRIAFVSERAGTPQIYVMKADGTGVRRITFQGNYNQTPSWSPRGDAIAFTARDERKVFDVFTVSPETTVISRVTQDQGRTNEEPSWAPNGRMLVFQTDRNDPDSRQLVISDPKGDRQFMIVASKDADYASPVWGPPR